MEGERPSEYFLNLQKLQANNNSIRQFISENRTVLTQHMEILAEQKEYCQRLYSQDQSTQNIESLADQVCMALYTIG